MEQLLLVIIGTIIGVLSVILGGGFFWSIPFWQYLYPDAALGVIVDNLKVGSVFRGFSSTFATWDQISWKKCFIISLPLLLGTLSGATLISKITQTWLMFTLPLSAIVIELSPYLVSVHKIEKTAETILCSICNLLKCFMWHAKEDRKTGISGQTLVIFVELVLTSQVY